MLKVHSAATRDNWAPKSFKFDGNHPRTFHNGSIGCYKCGQEGSFMKECHKNRRGSVFRGNRAQYSSVAPPDGAGAPRGCTFGTGGGENHLYAITSHQEYEKSSDDFTSMIKVFTFDVMLF